MKHKLISILAGIFIVAPMCVIGQQATYAYPNVPTMQPSFTQAGGSNSIINNGGILAVNNGSDFTSKRTTSGNVGVQQMSTAAGNNLLLDMFTATNSFQGQLGVTYGSGGDVGIWASKATGTGTNVWGYPIDFLGGINFIGNPFWYDIPRANSLANNVGIYWGFGPSASTFSAAKPSGPSSTVQSALDIVNANPFAGAGGIKIKGGFTNSIHGALVGTNADGIKIYVHQYGFQMLQLGDAYSADGTLKGGEAQQAPSNNILMNDNSIGFYFSINDGRPGDTYIGQVPLMCLDSRSGNYRFRIPYQVADVWAVTNVGWKDTLYADENSGAVIITNGQTTLSSILGYGTNVGAYIFGRNYYTNALFNVNGSSIFALPVEIYGNYGAFTFDSSGPNRLGIILQQGQFPKVAMASGAPFVIAHSSQSDLQSGVAAATITSDLTIDGSGNTTINRGSLALTSGVITNNGTVWLSTNATPTQAYPNGSIATITDGRFFVRSNSTWVLH